LEVFASERNHFCDEEKSLDCDDLEGKEVDSSRTELMEPLEKDLGNPCAGFRTTSHQTPAKVPSSATFPYKVFSVALPLRTSHWSLIC
jgi:hypothetical protein